ncbi:MAG: oxidoreductase [Pseudonocardiaceae bacterium]|nr:oxidoreductase [Pseudonocardiaceae bacterium]
MGGDRNIARMGFGTMRLPAWPTGTQPNTDDAIRVLRRAVELGVNHIDTAAFYARDGVSANALIREALHPYPDDLVLATKVGPRFDGTTQLPPAEPRELRADVEHNLRELGTDRIDLVNLRVGGLEGPSDEPLSAHFAALAELREEGLIRHLGLSNVTADRLAEAQRIAPVASVQNHYNLANRADDKLVDTCAEQGIGYVPFFPLGGHVDPDFLADERIVAVSRRRGATPAQVVLAWLLGRASSMLLIPGTGSVRHLEQNIAAINVALDEHDYAELNSIGSS